MLLKIHDSCTHTLVQCCPRVSYKYCGTDFPPCTDLSLLLSMYNSLPYDPFYLFYVSHPTLVNMMIYNMVDDILATISMLWLLFQCFVLNVYEDENLCVCVCLWKRERERERDSKGKHPYSSWNSVVCTVYILGINQKALKTQSFV